eukprot:s2068_g3.t5
MEGMAKFGQPFDGYTHRLKLCRNAHPIAASILPCVDMNRISRGQSFAAGATRICGACGSHCCSRQLHVSLRSLRSSGLSPATRRYRILTQPSVFGMPFPLAATKLSPKSTYSWCTVVDWMRIPWLPLLLQMSRIRFGQGASPGTGAFVTSTLKLQTSLLQRTCNGLPFASFVGRNLEGMTEIYHGIPDSVDC